MAGRTSGSVGVVATIVTLSVLTLGFFVAFAVYFGKNSSAVRDLAQFRQEQQDIIGSERNTDTVRALTEEAKKSPEKSLVAYLVSSREALLQRITGDKRDTLAGIEARLEGVEDADAPLVSMIKNRDATIQGLRQQLTQSDAARQQAVADLQSEVGRLQQLEARHRASIEELNNQVGIYKSEVDEHGTRSDKVIAQASEQVGRIKNEAAESDKRLQDRVNELNERNLILEAQLATLRGTRSKDLFKGQDEAALVDGRVISLNEADRSIVIDIGLDKKVVLGMPFAVYPNAAAMQPNAAGEYARGKAALEVIRVSATTATCRVTSELKGNPVVRGDVIANPLYDPSKQYTFVVTGGFDTDRDGLASAVEKSDIEAMIVAWGGKVASNLAGDVDFVVLGARPALPPRPGVNAPLEVVLEFQRRLGDVTRYDDMQKEAVATSVPVLNENRLYTLIGKTPAPTRR